jgi:hypothetical protein
VKSPAFDNVSSCDDNTQTIPITTPALPTLSSLSQTTVIQSNASLSSLLIERKSSSSSDDDDDSSDDSSSDDSIGDTTDVNTERRRNLGPPLFHHLWKRVQHQQDMDEDD